MSYKPQSSVNTTVKNYMIETGAGAPLSTPSFIGQRYEDTTNKVSYTARGTASSADWELESSYQFISVAGTLTKVFTKYLTGTTDASTTTNVAHGISSGSSKILSVATSIAIAATTFSVSDYRASANTNTAHRELFNDTNISLLDVGSTCQSQSYKIRIDYIV